MESSKPIILITGITGYIGSYVGLVFLNNCFETYRIRATVRSLSNKAKLDPLKEAFGIERFNAIQWVEADLNDEKSLSAAVEGVHSIIHVASPIPGQQNLSEEEMVNGTTKGTKTIIEAAVRNQVKKIVVTASFASISGNMWKKS